jgi:hypothetical protein
MENLISLLSNVAFPVAFAVYLLVIGERREVRFAAKEKE